MQPLAWDDPVPPGPRRVLVVGCSGAGKSTLAAALSARWHIPYHELDALHHGPGWTVRPEFAAEVAAFAATDEWVAEWQYDTVRPLLLGRATLVVWLDLSRARVFSSLLRRTVVRRVRRTTLWNGNVEPPLWTVFTDPEHVLRWAVHSYPRSRERVLAVLAAGQGPPVVRLRTRREVGCWLSAR